MTFGTAVGEQGQSTHDSGQITLHLKYQIKPIQLGTPSFLLPSFKVILLKNIATHFCQGLSMMLS